jgi:hypothetical protein
MMIECNAHSTLYDTSLHTRGNILLVIGILFYNVFFFFFFYISTYNNIINQIDIGTFYMLHVDKLTLEKYEYVLIYKVFE